jgi:hypothetical protein
MAQPYTITYSNHFKVDDLTFAFRKKLLFDITNTPVYKPILENNGSKGWWINRKWISMKKTIEILKKEPITVDVSDLQWYEQINLEECFNLCN